MWRMGAAASIAALNKVSKKIADNSLAHIFKHQKDQQGNVFCCSLPYIRKCALIITVLAALASAAFLLFGGGEDVYYTLFFVCAFTIGLLITLHTYGWRYTLTTKSLCRQKWFFLTEEYELSELKKQAEAVPPLLENTVLEITTEFEPIKIYTQSNGGYHLAKELLAQISPSMVFTENLLKEQLYFN